MIEEQDLYALKFAKKLLYWLWWLSFYLTHYHFILWNHFASQKLSTIWKKCKSEKIFNLRKIYSESFSKIWNKLFAWLKKYFKSSVYKKFIIGADEGIELVWNGAIFFDISKVDLFSWYYDLLLNVITSHPTDCQSV